MKKRDARRAARQAKEMVKQIDLIQELVVNDDDNTLWSVATAARWAVNALEDVMDRHAAR